MQKLTFLITNSYWNFTSYVYVYISSKYINTYHLLVRLHLEIKCYLKVKSVIIFLQWLLFPGKKGLGFVGSQPVSLDVTNITLLHQMPYNVSWKADGFRYHELYNLLHLVLRFIVRNYSQCMLDNVFIKPFFRPKKPHSFSKIAKIIVIPLSRYLTPPNTPFKVSNVSVRRESSVHDRPRQQLL